MLNKIIALAIAAGFASASFAQAPAAAPIAAPAIKPAAAASAAVEKKVEAVKADAMKAAEPAKVAETVKPADAAKPAPADADGGGVGCSGEIAYKNAQIVLIGIVRYAPAKAFHHTQHLRHGLQLLQRRYALAG